MKHVWTYWGAISGQLKPVRRSGQRNTGWGSRDADPIRFGLSCGLKPVGRLERGSARCSWVRVPGGFALNCWGDSPPTADLQKWLTMVV